MLAEGSTLDEIRSALSGIDSANDATLAPDTFSGTQATPRMRALRSEYPEAWGFGVYIGAQALSQLSKEDARSVIRAGRPGVFDFAEQIEHIARNSFQTWLAESDLHPPEGLRSDLFDAVGLGAGAVVVDQFFQPNV